MVALPSLLLLKLWLCPSFCLWGMKKDFQAFWSLMKAHLLLRKRKLFLIFAHLHLDLAIVSQLVNGNEIWGFLSQFDTFLYVLQKKHIFYDNIVALFLFGSLCVVLGCFLLTGLPSRVQNFSYVQRAKRVPVDLNSFARPKIGRKFWGVVTVGLKNT